MESWVDSDLFQDIPEVPLVTTSREDVLMAIAREEAESLLPRLIAGTPGFFNHEVNCFWDERSDLADPTDEMDIGIEFFAMHLDVPGCQTSWRTYVPASKCFTDLAERMDQCVSALERVLRPFPEEYRWVGDGEEFLVTEEDL